MSFYLDLEKRKEIVRAYLRENPRATFREIKKDLHTKIDKVYEGGMDEAYENAEIPKPRTLRFKTIDEKRKIIIDYLKANPGVGGQVIKKDTKINFLTFFKNTKEMFDTAGIFYPREKHRLLKNRADELKAEQIIEAIKKDPLLSIDKLGREIRVHPYALFKNTREIYEKAGIPFIDRGLKRRIKKQDKVIAFIKENPISTQREINKHCKTKVQSLFDKGIFGAYEKANLTFPYQRLNLHGIVIKSIKEEARKFEEEIAIRLSGYGAVNRLVRTKRGFADIILERKGKKVAIELKNYKVHEISLSQIKQVNKYLEDINSNLGFLICLKKPKKDNFLIGNNKIIVLEEQELDKIPKIMDLW